MAQMFMLLADTLQLETWLMPSQITFSHSMKARPFPQLMMALEQQRKPNQHYNLDQEPQRLNRTMTLMRMKSALNKAKVLKSQSTPQLQLRNAHPDMVPPASSRPSSSPKNACLAAKSYLKLMVKSTTFTLLTSFVQISTCKAPLYSSSL